MIPEALVEEVRRLLAAGTQSMRTIARTAGVSRGTVAAIAHGTRRDRPPRHGDLGDPEEEPLGPIERCPECGALAHAPCRACRVRNLLHSRDRTRPWLLPEEPLQLELAGECRQRYEEVHARRMREGWGE